jgi:hypothetical protein
MSGCLDSERYELGISVQIERLLKCVYSGYMMHGHNAVNEGIYESFLYPTVTMGSSIQAHRPSVYQEVIFRRARTKLEIDINKRLVIQKIKLVKDLYRYRNLVGGELLI